jgi:uncharacterized protein (DUF4213/DUF364 family)
MEVRKMITDELVELALEKAENRKVKDLRAGLGYTCVMLDSRECGLAYTFRNSLGECCDILNEAGSLIGKPATEIIPWLRDNNCLKSAIGLATVNALINNSRYDMQSGNVMDVIDVLPDETFGMVGEFKPILGKVNEMTKNVYIFEENAKRCGEVYHENSISIRLPECNVVIITATSIINHTIDQVLLYCKNARKVCIVGPSTPLCPDLFKRHGVNILAGSIVKNPTSILEIVSQGGGTKTMKPAVKQVYTIM